MNTTAPPVNTRSPEEESAIPSLVALSAKLRDRAAAFKNAGRRSDSGFETRTLEEFAAERRRFAEEIDGALERLDAESPDSGTLAANLRRGAKNFAAEVFDPEGDPAIEECHMGEYFAEKEYVRLLDELELPPGVRRILETQKNRTELALRYLRRLRGAGR